MRRLILLAVLLIGAALYIVSPFYAAWNLRESIKAGDTATIERKVIWPAVRESLRASLAANSRLLEEANALGEAARPSMWQRLKSALGASMLDRFIETYVTPEGLPKLMNYRRMWNEKMRGESNDDALPLDQRVSRFLKRITRAEFKSLTRVEIEMAEKSKPEQRVVTVMELYGTEWKLAGLQIITKPLPAGAAASSTKQTQPLASSTSEPTREAAAAR